MPHYRCGCLDRDSISPSHQQAKSGWAKRITDRICISAKTKTLPTTRLIIRHARLSHCPVAHPLPRKSCQAAAETIILIQNCRFVTIRFVALLMGLTCAHVL